MVAADKGYQSIVEALLVGGVDVDYKHQVLRIMLSGNTIIMMYGDVWLQPFRQLVGLLYSLLQRMVE